MRKTDFSGTLKEAGKYDVIVVGGGPAGVPAALAAARLGMKTLIIEQFNCLGGVATAGGHCHYSIFTAWMSDQRVVGGIPWEMANRISRAGFAETPRRSLDCEIEGMKLVLDQMMVEAGVDILYYTFFADVFMEDNDVAGVIVQNKSGRSLYRASRVIDCTGDGDAAYSAGCEFNMGDESGNCQPMTLMFTIGGVDYDALDKFCREPGHTVTLSDVWELAQKNGDMRPFQKTVMGWWFVPSMPTYLGINFTHVNNVSACNAEDLTRATIEARKQAYETIKVYRKYVKGMENCYMVSTPNTVGTRESRRICGEYTLTIEDLYNEKKTFEDSIGYGGFFVDVHNCSGPGMDKAVLRPKAGFHYQIPYRILVPEKIENLLVAGRCVSVTHQALGSLRVMAQCSVMGEAAGTAAALSIREKVVPRQLDHTLLCGTLHKNGCILSENDTQMLPQKK